MKQWIWLWLVAGMLAHAQVTEVNSGSRREMRVHVVDTRGAPVTGLEPNAFHITSLGEKTAHQPITGFQEVDFTGQRDVNPPSAAVTFARPHEKRFVVLALDSSYMDKRSFRRFQQVARHYVEHLRRPGDLVKLVHIDYGMLALTPFTNDQTVLLAAIEKARYRGSLFRDLKQLERRMIDAVVQHLQDQQSFYASQISFLVQNKEILKKDYLYAFYSHMLRLEQDLRPRDGGRSILLLSGGAFVEYNSRGSNTEPYMERLGEVLNNANITVYGLLVKRGLMPFSAMVNNSNFDRFKGAAIDELTLSNTGSYPPGSGTNNTSNTVFENNRQLETGPRELTTRTGGILAVPRSAELDRSLADLIARTDHYYRIAWNRAKSPGTTFSVTLRKDLQNRGYRIFYGPNFSGGTPYLKLSSKARAVEFELLLCCSRTFVNEMNATFGYDVFLGEDRTYRISVYTRLPGEVSSGATLEVGFALISTDNRIIDMTRSELPLQKQTRDQLLYDVLITEQIPAVVRFYVRNMDTGALSLSEQKLDQTQVVKPGEPLSHILLSRVEPVQLWVLPKLHDETARAELRRIEDPLFIGDRYVLPHVAKSFITPEEITFYFHQYDVTKKQEDYQLALSLRDGDDQLIRLGSTLNRVYEHTRRTYRWFGSLDTRSLPPGEYNLTIEITDKVSGDRYRRTSHFLVAKGL